MSIASNFPAIKPSLNLDFANTKMLDSRVTFTRASTGTYYNGVTTAKAEENLLTYSQEFDNAAWNKSGTSVTANSTTAPDGSSTAETLAETATTETHVLFGTAGTSTRFSVINGSTYAFSVFLKKGSGATAPDIMQVGYGATGFPTTFYANFNLSAGTVTATGAGASSSSIVSVGNGWYRCSVIGNANSSTTANTTLAVAFVNNNSSATREPSYAGATTADVLVWGAQVEQRSVVTAYTATTTQPITNYIPVLLTAQSGVPRFDHNPTTDESLGLLIEESRTNLFTYSEQFDNASWTKTRSSITANSIAAPDGTVTADKLVEDTASGTHQISKGASQLANITYTYSVYAKAGERTSFTVSRTNTPIVSFTHTYDLSTGTASGGGSMTLVGNGWYRCVGQYSATADHVEGIVIRLVNTSGNTSYTGDGYSGIYIWGAQLEAGAFATSYIKTEAAAVTRAADAASMTGTNFSSWFSNAEGTLFVEYATAATAENNSIVSISINSNGGRIQLSHLTGARRFSVVDGGVNQVNDSGGSLGSVTANTSSKFVGAYQVNNFASAVNGGTVVTDTSGLVPVVDRLFIGADGVNSNPLNGTIKKLAYYPMRVTNAQLQALTS